MEVKITTFNIQSCKNYVTKVFEPSLMANTIKQMKSEIIGLNEVRGEGPNELFTNQVRKIANELGYKYYYFGNAIYFENKGPYGNAFISKYPIFDVKKIKIPDPLIKDEDAYYETRNLLKIKVLINEKIVTFFITHVGLAKSEAKNAIEVILTETKKCDSEFVLMGDFNMTPDNDHIKNLQSLYYDTVNSFTIGFKTFPSINPVKKIDYIFTNKLTVKSALVEEIVASDHYPVSAIIEI